MRTLFNYEKRHQGLAPQSEVLKRLVRNMILAGFMIALSLAAGMAGYMYFENLTVIDAFLNTAMILSGMGPVAAMQSAGGKIFAGLYAIYSGVFIIATTAVILAPIIHRLLHKFHLADEDGGKS